MTPTELAARDRAHAEIKRINTESRFVTSGSVMLNLVLGGGWAAGRIVNIVGDKCLAGDTIVSVQRGDKPHKMAMQTLFNRVKGEHWNRSVTAETYLVADVGGYAGTNKLLDIVMSGEKTLYEITNDRGQTIKASADHKFAAPEAPDGWACLSDDLTIGSKVRCWQGTRDVVQQERDRKPRAYIYSIPFHPFGQRSVVGGRDYKRLLKARLVLEAAINGLDLLELIHVLRNDPTTAATLQYTDPVLDVHHLDDDCTNDDIDNLQLIEPGDHWKVHADAMPQNTKAIGVAEIVSIKRIGVEPTFDITMEAPHHNFIANGFVVHNSTGKTLLAIEACANYTAVSSIEQVRYAEAEAAFDVAYAQTMGMPEGLVPFAGCETVEHIYDDLQTFLGKVDPHYPSLYVLDSLDALSDAAEMERDIDKGSYGASKARKLSELFRRIVKPLERANCTLFIVSQIRDKLNVTFGETKTRSGGRALDFYASQIVWLAEIEKVKRTVRGAERVTGLWVRALAKKNKLYQPYRSADLAILFGYGVHDAMSMLDWLKSNKNTDNDWAATEKQMGPLMKQGDRTGLRDIEMQLAAAVEKHWRGIDEDLAPRMRKY